MNMWRIVRTRYTFAFDKCKLLACVDDTKNYILIRSDLAVYLYFFCVLLPLLLPVFHIDQQHKVYLWSFFSGSVLHGFADMVNVCVTNRNRHACCSYQCCDKAFFYSFRFFFLLSIWLCIRTVFHNDMVCTWKIFRTMNEVRIECKVDLWICGDFNVECPMVTPNVNESNLLDVHVIEIHCIKPNPFVHFLSHPTPPVRPAE